MIPIYLCEDDAHQLAHLKETIEKFIFIEALDMEIVCAARTPGTLLSALPATPASAAYFLDIQLNASMDGIELAAEIRRKDPRAFIIFTTTHSEMAMTTFRYKVEPLDFLLKDDPHYIPSVLNCLLNIVEKNCVPAVSATGRMHFRLPEQDIFLPVDEILYIQSTLAHKITIYTTHGIYQCSGSLRDAQDKLGSGFFLSHKSCLVNVSHIRGLQKDPLLITLDNGDTCSCAQRRYSKLQKFMERI